jgi:hypothetical protein
VPVARAAQAEGQNLPCGDRRGEPNGKRKTREKGGPCTALVGGGRYTDTADVVRLRRRKDAVGWGGSCVACAGHGRVLVVAGDHLHLRRPVQLSYTKKEILNLKTTIVEAVFVLHHLQAYHVVGEASRAHAVLCVVQHIDTYNRK